ncbi:MAG TPA: TlpA disulfide reductase family protein [Pirellulales bacterium]|nr:TlpA disulfide reductase family protein [Pirellulales bacterium]
MMHRPARIALLGLAFVAWGCAPAPKPAQQVSLEIKDYDGLQQVIAAHKGKVVVLDVWSTSCEPCMKEFPNLVALSRKHPGVAAISLSLDYEGVGKPEAQREKVLGFLKQQDARFDNILASDDSDTMLKKLGIASMPAVFVYDQSGKRIHTFDKPGFTYHDIEPEVRKLLGETTGE